MSLKQIFTNLRLKFPSGKIELYNSMIWFQFSNSIDTLNFEIYDWTTIDASSEKTAISYKKELLNIIKKINVFTPKHLVLGLAIETLISDLFDSAEFVETEFVESLKKTPKMDAYYGELRKLISNSNREILMVSFGEKFKSPSSMERNFISSEYPFKCDKTFDARHINSSRPKTGGLCDLRGTDEIIQKCIESGTGFEFVMGCIVKSIETNNYKTIGVYCTAGHHRSQAVCELLKKYLYPNAKIKHLHNNHR